jgi:hypothetical protein
LEEEQEAAGGTPATDPTLGVRVSWGRMCGARERRGGGGTHGEEDRGSAEASGSGGHGRRRPGRRQAARSPVRRQERNEKQRSTRERERERRFSNCSVSLKVFELGLGPVRQ